MGPGGSGDYVNGKVKSSLISRDACQAVCDAAPACVGYAYYAHGGRCFVYGPGLDTDLAGGWRASTSPTTTISGASGDGVWSASTSPTATTISPRHHHPGVVCSAVAGAQ